MEYTIFCFVKYIFSNIINSNWKSEAFILNTP